MYVFLSFAAFDQGWKKPRFFKFLGFEISWGFFNFNVQIRPGTKLRSTFYMPVSMSD